MPTLCTQEETEERMVLSRQGIRSAAFQMMPLAAPLKHTGHSFRIASFKSPYCIGSISTAMPRLNSQWLWSKPSSESAASVTCKSFMLIQQQSCSIGSCGGGFCTSVDEAVLMRSGSTAGQQQQQQLGAEVPDHQEDDIGSHVSVALDTDPDLEAYLRVRSPVLTNIRSVFFWCCFTHLANPHHTLHAYAAR
jgi:hypothetical protein